MSDDVSCSIFFYSSNDEFSGIRTTVHRFWCRHIFSPRPRPEKVFTHFLCAVSKCFIRVTEIDSNYKSFHRTYFVPVFLNRMTKTGAVNTDPSLGKTWYASVDIIASLYQFRRPNDLNSRYIHQWHDDEEKYMAHHPYEILAVSENYIPSIGVTNQ